MGDGSRQRLQQCAAQFRTNWPCYLIFLLCPVYYGRVNLDTVLNCRPFICYHCLYFGHACKIWVTGTEIRVTNIEWPKYLGNITLILGVTHLVNRGQCYKAQGHEDVLVSKGLKSGPKIKCRIRYRLFGIVGHRNWWAPTNRPIFSKLPNIQTCYQWWMNHPYVTVYKRVCRM